MISASQMMENQYGHLFEKVIVNDDLTVAFNELKQALRKVETETHWVPISWTHSWGPAQKEQRNKASNFWGVETKGRTLRTVKDFFLSFIFIFWL